MAYQIAALIVLLALSAFFSGSETALVSLSRLRIVNLVKEKKRGSEALMKLKKDPKRLLITILIGNNLVNVAASVLATNIVISQGYPHVFGIVTGVMTLLLLVFGEITPKTFATAHNVRLSLLVAEPIYMLSVMIYPLVVLFDFIANFFTSIFGWKIKKNPVVTEAEIKSIVELGGEAGTVKKLEEAMIKNIFRLDDVMVKDIMTTKERIFSIDADTKLKDALPLVLKKPYSRIPIHAGDKQHIVGVVYIVDLLKQCNAGKTDIPMKQIRKKVFFIFSTRTIDVLLKQFLAKRIHMAVVVDDLYNLAGVVTLEDVLEEIVGEIVDEKEAERLKLKVK